MSGPHVHAPRSFAAIQHCQACAREMESVPRAKPGGLPGFVSSAGGLWQAWCWEEGTREDRLAGESVHVMEVKKHMLYVVPLLCARRSCGC